MKFLEMAINALFDDKGHAYLYVHNKKLDEAFR